MKKGFKDEVIAVLKQDLKAKGLLNPVSEDMIETYRQLAYIKSELEKDIKENGVTREYNHGGGQSGMKKNESIGELNKVITQMSKILYDLGLRVRDVVDRGEDEGDDL